MMVITHDVFGASEPVHVLVWVKNMLAEREIEDRLSVEVPVLVSVTSSVALESTTTLPKLAGAGVSVADTVRVTLLEAAEGEPVPTALAAVTVNV